MRLYIIRHGETIENRKGIIQGHNQGTLTDDGLAQAKAIAKRLAEEPVDVIYSSDLKRAYDTAKEIAAYHSNIPFITIASLRERNFGELQGAHESIWDPDNLPSSVETSEAFELRAKGVLEELLGKHPNKRVLVTTHGSIAGRIVKAITGQRPQELCGTSLCNASLTIIEIRPDWSYDLVLLNSTEHLDSKENCRAPGYN